MKIEIALPTVTEIVQGLTPHEAHSPLGESELRVKQAEERLAAAREELRVKELDVARLNRDVAVGTSPVAALEGAISAVRARSLSLPGLERAVEEAVEQRAAAWRVAQDRIVERVARRKEKLQAIADKVTPVLEALVELDRALAQLLDKEFLTTGITWPCSNVTTITLTNAEVTAGGIALQSAGYKSFSEAQWAPDPERK